MKVESSEDFSAEQWVDSLSIRIQLPLQPDPDESAESDEESWLEQTSPPPIRKSRFTRSSPASLMALRNLPPGAPLLLLTPVLVPAGLSGTTLDELQRRDPFETLGRHLAKHHANICHVPYIAGVGLTDMHLGFIMDSEAVITVVCEPSHSSKRDSMREQHQFAEAALKAFNSRAMVEPGDGEFVLVQCAAEDARQRMQYAFANVVETASYNELSAVYLADSIFGYA